MLFSTLRLLFPFQKCSNISSNSCTVYINYTSIKLCVCVCVCVYKTYNEEKTSCGSYIRKKLNSFQSLENFPTVMVTLPQHLILELNMRVTKQNNTIEQMPLGCKYLFDLFLLHLLKTSLQEAKLFHISSPICHNFLQS